MRVPSIASICSRAFVPILRRFEPPLPIMMYFCDSRSTYRFTCTSSSGLSSGRPSRNSISSTVTAIEWGSSSRAPSSAASRTSSAMRVASGSSVSSPSGYSGGDSGVYCASRSATASTWKCFTADTGIIAAQPPLPSTGIGSATSPAWRLAAGPEPFAKGTASFLPPLPLGPLPFCFARCAARLARAARSALMTSSPSASTASSCSRSSSELTVSAFVTIATTGLLLDATSCDAM